MSEVIKLDVSGIIAGDEINVGGTWMVVQGTERNEENFVDLDLGNESLLSISKSAVIEVRRSLPEHVVWLLQSVDTQDRQLTADVFRRRFPDVINHFREAPKTEESTPTPVVYSVGSWFDRDKTYTLTYFPDTDSWTCTCPSSQYRPNASCKHVLDVARYPDDYTPLPQATKKSL